ncbi:tetratricopeptide repeat protein [Planctomycetota bacterium]
MARKKLNKKVAILGIVVFMFAVLLGIAAILYLSQDPQKFIDDGDASLKLARQETDEELKSEIYAKAAKGYHKARSRSKSDEQRIEILFKLVDLYMETGEWKFVRGCWNQIIQIDPKNIRARLGQIKYFYIVADNGVLSAWRDVGTQAIEFLEVLDQQQLAQSPDNWKSFEIQPRASGQTLESYLYLLNARANFIGATTGAVADPNQSLGKAIDDLEKVREIEPSNADLYLYLAQTTLQRMQLQPLMSPEQKENILNQIEKYLEIAVDNAGEDTKAHLFLLSMKPFLKQITGIDQYKALEAEYMSIIEQFHSDPQVYSALVEYYLRLGHEYLDKAIGAIEKSIELDDQNVDYAKIAAGLYYQRFSLQKRKSDVRKAIKIAENALELPDTQESTGPRFWANKSNRFFFYRFLADCYIEQVLNYRRNSVGTEAQVQQWMENAEKMVYGIEQILGSGEDPQVIKYQGMLELARGNEDEAVRKLYATYEMFKSADQPDGKLAYELARIFKNSPEVGATIEFLRTALDTPGFEQTMPEVRLDFADLMLKRQAWQGVLTNVAFYEQNYGQTDRSQQLRINALIRSKQFEQAKEELAKRDADDPNTIKLDFSMILAEIAYSQQSLQSKKISESSDILLQQLDEQEDSQEQENLQRKPLTADELKNYMQRIVDEMENVYATDKDFLRSIPINTFCNYYIVQNQIGKAKSLMAKYLGYFPDNTKALSYKRMLDEPDPLNISAQRKAEIEKEVLSEIDDPDKRFLALSAFYRRNNEPNQAIAGYEKYLFSNNVDTSEESIAYRKFAAAQLFELALFKKEQQKTEKVIEISRKENLDGCNGDFFAAQLYLTKGQYEDALTKIDECLKQRPIFSQGYMLRSTIYNALKNDTQAVENARKAVTLNPENGAAAKMLAVTLYAQNQMLGDKVTSEQIDQTKAAMYRAIRLNPSDTALPSVFAEFISDESPTQALAIRQRLQKAFPSLENTLMLGKMAMRIAAKESDPRKKEFLFNTAESAYKLAMAAAPQNIDVLNSYAEYYRQTDRPQEAEKLLKQSQNQKLLWVHYIYSGQYSKAKQALEQIRQDDPENIDAIKGLVIIAEKTGNKDDIKEYTDLLISADDSVQNKLSQIQLFLNMGLIQEVEKKLQSFRERYPDDPTGALFDGWLAMKQGQLDQAMKLINLSLENNQENLYAWWLRGRINYLKADYGQAISDFKASKIILDRPATRFDMAKAYVQIERYEDAILELRNIISQKQADQLYAKAVSLLEYVYAKVGKTNDLNNLYDDLMDKFSDNHLWNKKAAVFAMRTGDYYRASSLYEQLWNKVKDEQADNRDVLGGYLYALMMDEKVNKLFDVARKQTDGRYAPTAFIGMAEAMVKIKDKQSAIAYSRKAVDKAGTDDRYLSFVMMQMYRLLGPQELQLVCEEMLRTNPDSFAANYSMYNLAEINANYNKAISYLDKCMQILGPQSPGITSYRQKKAILLLSAYTKTSDKGYLQKSIEEHESLLEKMPNNTTVLNNLAYILAENDEKLEKALEYAEQVWKLRPDDAAVVDTYAYVLYKNGKYKQAGQYMQSAIQGYSDEQAVLMPEVYMHSGMIQEKLGNKTQALDAYKQAEKLGNKRLSTKDMDLVKSAIQRLSY